MEALMDLNSNKGLKLLNKNGVLPDIELKSGHHIRLEKYTKDIEIEAKALYDTVTTQIIPSGMKFQKELVDSIAAASDAPGSKADFSVQKDFLIGVTMLLSNIRSASKSMKESCEKAGSIDNEQDKAEYSSKEIRSRMDAIREDIDKLETFVDDDLRSIPKSWEMLHIS
jgi:glutamine synthetase